MYDFLRGTVVSLDPSGRLALDVNGVGYALRVSEQTRRTIPIDGRPVTLHVRLQVKEDDLVLFGFADQGERAAFDLLLSVQGVGPAVALAVLSHLGVAELRRGLTVRDVKAFTAVKGVGTKTAERIVLELADKAERLIRNLARTLEREAPGVAGSILEGLDEILTVSRLGLPIELRRSLACTNIIENMNGTVRRVSHNVKRWRDASMALRWTAAGMMEAAKGFRRLKARDQLPTLRDALQRHHANHFGLDETSKAA